MSGSISASSSGSDVDPSRAARVPSSPVKLPLQATLALLLAPLLVAPLLARPATAHADDDDGPLRLMNEPTSFTDVIDAADEGDPFDLNVRVGFRRSVTTATLSRETAASAGSTVAGRLAIADYEHARNELDLGIELGVFRDVMLYFAMPIVLRDSRKLSLPSGTSTEGLAAINTALSDPYQNSDGVVITDEQLFTMPFTSPDRSGIDEIHVGAAFDVMNQARRPHLPTWMMKFEFQLGVGPLIKACAEGDSDCGVSEGIHRFVFETRLSRRWRMLEPYGGIGFLFAWTGSAADRFSPEGDLAGYSHTRPPMEGWFTVGTSVVPWEQRARWQRFSIDVQLSGRYISESRDYTPLFDALGSSTHPQLTTPIPEGVDPTRTAALRQVGFTGVTDVQAHVGFGGQLAIELQAARYVRFRFGGSLERRTKHLLTYTDQCNPNVEVEEDDPRIGGCDSGIINPMHRYTLDAPGRRFFVDGTTTYDIFVQAQAQF